MSFIYPLGLIGLIGVPILIIIYIIKTKHTEQIIPSIYLWNLSEQFLKRKKQKKLVSGLVSLILQIIIVVSVSLLIAHPVITLPNKAKDYCFILDASGSMAMEENGVKKIELGIDKIEEVIYNYLKSYEKFLHSFQMHQCDENLKHILYHLHILRIYKLILIVQFLFVFLHNYYAYTHNGNIYNQLVLYLFSYLAN